MCVCSANDVAHSLRYPCYPLQHRLRHSDLSLPPVQVRGSKALLTLTCGQCSPCLPPHTTLVHHCARFVDLWLSLQSTSPRACAHTHLRICARTAQPWLSLLLSPPSSLWHSHRYLRPFVHRQRAKAAAVLEAAAELNAVRAKSAGAMQGGGNTTMLLPK